MPSRVSDPCDSQTPTSHLPFSLCVRVGAGCANRAWHRSHESAAADLAPARQSNNERTSIIERIALIAPPRGSETATFVRQMPITFATPSETWSWSPAKRPSMRWAQSSSIHSSEDFDARSRHGQSAQGGRLRIRTSRADSPRPSQRHRPDVAQSTRSRVISLAVSRSYDHHELPAAATEGRDRMRGGRAE